MYIYLYCFGTGLGWCGDRLFCYGFRIVFGSVWDRHRAPHDFATNINVSPKHDGLQKTQLLLVNWICWRPSDLKRQFVAKQMTHIYIYIYICIYVFLCWSPMAPARMVSLLSKRTLLAYTPSLTYPGGAYHVLVRNFHYSLVVFHGFLFVKPGVIACTWVTTNYMVCTSSTGPITQTKHVYIRYQNTTSKRNVVYAKLI